MMDFKDELFIGMLVINTLALFLAAWSIRRQADAIDVRLYFQITEKISTAWRQYKDSEEENRNFEMTELLNLLESLAHFYFKRRIHGVTRDMVKEYLLEIVPEIGRENRVREVFQENRSGPDTYDYIRRFAKANDIANIPAPLKRNQAPK